MIAALLAEAVASAESFVDDGVFLYPGEARHVARAVPTRRRQFAAVRRCARDAIATVGVAPGPQAGRRIIAKIFTRPELTEPAERNYPVFRTKLLANR